MVYRDASSRQPHVPPGMPAGSRPPDTLTLPIRPIMMFETLRLTVRALRLDDFDAFHEMQSDPDVMRYTTGTSLDPQENLRQLKSCIEKYAAPAEGFFVWAAELKLDGAFVGTCALVQDDDGQFEIGYRLLQKFWKRGLGQELAAGLIDYCLRQRGLDRIVAHADIRNTASIRILEKTMDFFREGRHPWDDAKVRYYWRAARRP